MRSEKLLVWIILRRLLRNHAVTPCSVRAESLSGSAASAHGAPKTRTRGRVGGETKEDGGRRRAGGSQSVSPRRVSWDPSVSMRPRWLRLSAVDRLPTISEQQESDNEDGDPPDGPAHTMEEYVDSIKELSRPAPYPLHGPLRGHRRWTTCGRVKAAALTLFLSPAPWVPVDPSEVSLIFSEGAGPPRPNLLDLLVTHSLFSGLV